MFVLPIAVKNGLVRCVKDEGVGEVVIGVGDDRGLGLGPCLRGQVIPIVVKGLIVARKGSDIADAVARREVGMNSIPGICLGRIEGVAGAEAEGGGEVVGQMMRVVVAAIDIWVRIETLVLKGGIGEREAK